MAKEIQRPRDPQFLTRAAGSLFAAVTSQGVQCPGHYRRVLVVERADEEDEGLVVNEVIEDIHALASYDRLSMPKAATYGR